ncbi:hypothetical protein HUJ04_006403 [Dendroctonus ponderosae]
MLLYSLILFFMLTAKNGAFATETFVTFQQKYGKVYQNDSELSVREEIFKENLAKIEEHNKQFQQNFVSYELGLNQFSDLTEAEFQALLTMSPLSDQLTKQMEKYNSEFDIKTAPVSVNWAEKGVVTPVKNQGNCGSCWTFTTTGTIESRLALKTGSLVSLSEQQLLDCNRVNAGCDGGVLPYALQYVESAGLTTEDEYPYKAWNGTCNSTHKPVAAYTKGYTLIYTRSESDLMKAVAEGPVAVALNADLLQYYSKGIFNPSACSSTVNHGGLVVGYEENATLPYWIIKNSWGATWGENGYFRMAKGYNLCGITSQPIYPTKVSNTPIQDDSYGGASFMYQNYATCFLGLIACFLWNLFA